MIRVAIVGYGNIGRYSLEAVEAAPDMECAGIVRRSGSSEGFPELAGYRVCSDIRELGQVDVAVLCVPSRKVEENALKFLPMGINTVDCFDIHSDIAALRATLDNAAKSGNAVSVTAAGWDPGTDSIIRALFMGMVPSGDTYTTFGPGRSMGHSVVAASKPGVARALSMTLPAGKGRHSREVFIELEPGADFAVAERAIREDPYFAADPTTVKLVGSVDEIDTHNHGVCLEREGVSGRTQGQKMGFNMRINNPALTGQVLVMAARAALRQASGCYTMIEIPVIDYLPGSREELVRQLV